MTRNHLVVPRIYVALFPLLTLGFSAAFLLMFLGLLSDWEGLGLAMPLSAAIIVLSARLRAKTK